MCLSNRLISGKMVLFIGYSIDNNKQSHTMRSYMLAIKNVLLDDGVILNENRFLFSSFAKELDQELPFQNGILEILLINTRN